MAAARQENDLFIDRISEKIAQNSRHLHLLQDRQRFLPSPHLPYNHPDPTPQATYPVSSLSRPGFRTRHISFCLTQILTPTHLRYAFLDIGPLSQGHALVIPKGDHSPEAATADSDR